MAAFLAAIMIIVTLLSIIALPLVRLVCLSGNFGNRLLRRFQSVFLAFLAVQLVLGNGHFPVLGTSVRVHLYRLSAAFDRIATNDNLRFFDGLRCFSKQRAVNAYRVSTAGPASFRVDLVIRHGSACSVEQGQSFTSNTSNRIA